MFMQSRSSSLTFEKLLCYNEGGSKGARAPSQLWWASLANCCASGARYCKQLIRGIKMSKSWSRTAIKMYRDIRETGAMCHGIDIFLDFSEMKQFRRILIISHSIAAFVFFMSQTLQVCNQRLQFLMNFFLLQNCLWQTTRMPGDMSCA